MQEIDCGVYYISGNVQDINKFIYDYKQAYGDVLPNISVEDILNILEMEGLIYVIEHDYNIKVHKHTIH